MCTAFGTQLYVYMALKRDTSGTRAEISRTFEMWCWRLMEISCTDRVRNEKVLKSQGGEKYGTNNKKDEG